MTPSSCSRGCRARESRRWPSTPSMPRASAATSSRLSAYARQFLGQMEKPDVDFIEGLSPAISIDQKSTSTKPPIHRGDDHRGVRLPARSLCAGRATALSELRAAHRQADARSDRRPGPGAPRGHPVPGPGARGPRAARASTASSWKSSPARASLGRASTARSATSPSRSGCRRPTSTRSRSWWTGSWPSPTSVAASPIPSRPPWSWPRASRRSPSRPTRGTRRSRTSPRAWRAPIAGSPTRSSPPATSPSTRPTGRVRRATAWALGSRSTPSSSCPTRRCRSTKGRSHRGRRRPSSTGTGCCRRCGQAHGFDLDTPWKKLPKKARDVLLYGSDEPIYVRYKNRYGRQRSYWTTFEGALPNIERRHAETESDAAREKLEQFMREIPCRACKGARLRPESLAVTVGGLNIAQLTDLSIRDTLAFVDAMELSEREHMIAERLVKEIRSRLGFLRRRRPRLPHARTRRRHARRRRGAAHPPRDADRQRPRGRALHPGRALDRAASARQPPADRHAHPPARHRQHADRGGARRGDDRRGRSHRRHRPGGGGARRRDRVPGRPQGVARMRRVDHGGVPVGTARRSRCPRCAAGHPTAGSSSRGARAQPARTSPPRSRSVCSSASPASAARGSRRSCRTCCCESSCRRSTARGCCRVGIARSWGGSRSTR